MIQLSITAVSPALSPVRPEHRALGPPAPGRRALRPVRPEYRGGRNHRVAGLSDPGGRLNNEDAWLCKVNPQPGQAAKGRIFIVADGAGGYRGSGIASRAAAWVVQQAYYGDFNADVSASLRRAVKEANRQIHDNLRITDADGNLLNAQTTIAAAVIQGDKLMVANVGDSRVYLVKDGQAYPLTADHTWVEERRRRGILTDEEADNHPQRHLLTRSLGDDRDVQVDVFEPRQLIPGDRVLLCTDGLSDVVKDRELAEVVGGHHPAAAVRRLIARARECGATDNVTAVVVSTAAAREGEQQEQQEQAEDKILTAFAVALTVLAGMMLILGLTGIINVWH